MCSAGAVQAGNAGVLCIIYGQNHHAVSFLGVLSGEWVFWGSFWDPLSSWWSWDLCSVGLCGTCALGIRPEMRIFIFCLFGAEPKPWVEDEALTVLSLGICMFIYSCLSGHWEPAVRAYWALFPRARWGDSVLIYTHLSCYRNCSKCSTAGLPGPTSVLKHELTAPTRKFQDNFLHSGMEVWTQTCWHIQEHGRIVNEAFLEWSMQ